MHEHLHHSEHLEHLEHLDLAINQGLNFDVLKWILLAAFISSILSIIFAGMISVSRFLTQRINAFVCYAIGALLGASFLEVIPHALEHSKDPHEISITILVGILCFFILEKLVLWRHCHSSHCEAHGSNEYNHLHLHTPSSTNRAGLLILVGDTFHNFVDGVLIAAAFMKNTELGFITALAIVAHEIPQEIGDFAILLNSGYSKSKAFLYNIISGLSTFVGAILAWFMLSSLQELIPLFLAVAASSMIYIAVADLIPSLHQKTDLKSSLRQVLLILLGVITIAVATSFIEH